MLKSSKGLLSFKTVRGAQEEEFCTSACPVMIDRCRVSWHSP